MYARGEGQTLLYKTQVYLSKTAWKSLSCGHNWVGTLYVPYNLTAEVGLLKKGVGDNWGDRKHSLKQGRLKQENREQSWLWKRELIWMNKNCLTVFTKDQARTQRPLKMEKNPVIITSLTQWQLWAGSCYIPPLHLSLYFVCPMHY